MRIAGFFLIVLMVAGCGPPMTQNAVYDFIEELSKADRDHDLFVIDMSRPDHYSFLTKGWHIPDEESFSGTRMIWSSDNISEVTLVSGNTLEKELIITLQPYRFESAPPVTMRVELNGHPVGIISLKNEWRTYRLTVPSDFVKKGQNQLTVIQSDVFRPVDVMVYSEDERQLGSSWSYIVFRDIQTPKTPGFYPLPQILGATQITWAGQRRQVVYDTAPGIFTWPVDLPARPGITFGIGYLPDFFERYGPNARFEMILTDEQDTPHRLFQTELQPPRRILEKGWTEYTRDLSAFAGQSVTITLKTDSERTAEGLVNSGSWLEPHIVNRHIDCNMIFLPLADYFDPDKLTPGSALEKVIARAGHTHRLAPFDTTRASVSGIPLDFIDTVTREGFWSGYFYTGYDPHEKHRKTRPVFRFSTGNENTDAFNVEAIFEECTDWIRTLDRRRFLIVFDTANWIPGPEMEYSELFRLLEWLIEYQFEMDSLIVIYSPAKTSPAWVLNPVKRAKPVSDISSRNELFHYISSEFLRL